MTVVHRSTPWLVPLLRLATLKTVALLEPQLKVFELTAANQATLRPDWTDQAAASVTGVLEALLRERGIAAVRAPPPAGSEALQREVEGLWGAVVDGVVQATYRNRFPKKGTRFDYGLGPNDGLLGEGVDAAFLVLGSGTSSTGGRVALQALSAALSGVHSTGVDRLFVGLVGRDGQLLWFGALESTDSSMSSSAGAARFAQDVTRGLPAVAR
jgi:hypothetical protein